MASVSVLRLMVAAAWDLSLCVQAPLVVTVSYKDLIVILITTGKLFFRLAPSSSSLYFQ